MGKNGPYWGGGNTFTTKYCNCDKWETKKAKVARIIIKKRVFLDKDIKPEIKLDLWNSGINSIMQYSTTTIAKTL